MLEILFEMLINSIQIVLFLKLLNLIFSFLFFLLNHFNVLLFLIDLSFKIHTSSFQAFIF